ncbi:MAG: LON peptidase substrate-binding domain-containing protein [Phycisphaerales bacterium]
MSEEISIRVNFGNPMALFPLDHVTLMPHAVLPLHIFEPRYRHMVSDALDGPGQIAMAVTMPGESGDPRRPALRPAVCVGQIVQHHKLPDGRYNIALQGVCRARIMQELPDDEDVPYRRAYLQPLGTARIDEEELAGARARLAEMLADTTLTDMTDAREVVKYLQDEDFPTSAVLELVTFTLLPDGELRYRLLAEPEAGRRALMIVRELTHIEELLRRAQAQRRVLWRAGEGDEERKKTAPPKGCSWN